MTTILAANATDVRFPTSHTSAGSDAMNADPDYSAAYVVLRTDHPHGLEGHGLTFTIGRGTDICTTALHALSPLVCGARLEDIAADMAGFWRWITSDSQLRWLGPEKGVIHLATAALVNAVWDLYAKAESKPLWKLLTDMSPEQLVGCVDFRYLHDAITPEEAVALLEDAAPGRDGREARLKVDGIPAYITSAGWLGYSDDEIRRRCRDAVAAGWTRFKIKVGADLDDDVRRVGLMREEIGSDALLMLDANQRWEVDEAVAWCRELAFADPYWIEEPTSPDDLLGHAQIAEEVAPLRVATGEHVHSRVMFKQLFALEATSFCQLDTCRLGGVNEALAVLLLATKFGVPTCPHSGGVGLSEYHQHLAAFDHIALGADGDDRMLEYTDHLHEHFLNPVHVSGNRYALPDTPGSGTELRRASLDAYRFPSGAAHAEGEDTGQGQSPPSMLSEG